jgi:methionyl-tRNA synthetase
MLRSPLEDLCVTRPKGRVSLGVELPFDKSFVAYVWFDALMNYLTSAGWPREGYLSWWHEAEHLIGKDVLKTHAVQWPCTLMALGEPLPRRISVHGHWVDARGFKMSKTAGNVVDPFVAVDRFGPSAVRFHLARHMRSGDSPLSDELLTRTFDELGDKLGNLILRVTAPALRHNGGVPPTSVLHPNEMSLLQHLQTAVAISFDELLELTSIPSGLERILRTVGQLNDYLTETTPWQLLKPGQDEARAQSIIYAVMDGLRLVLEALYPIMPIACEVGLQSIGASIPGSGHRFASSRLVPGTPLQPTPPLFPRRGAQPQLVR